MNIPPSLYAAIGTLLLVFALVVPSPLAELSTILGLGMVLVWMLG